AAPRAAALHEDDLVALVRSARDAAIEALAHTPEQLPALARAGVVDAGGSGLVLLLHALCHEVARDALPAVPPLESVPVHEHEVAGASLEGPTYEVMFLLEGDDARIPAFREVWRGLGESIVIVGGQGLYNCHIHTDDIGGALEASLDVGRPREIRVTNLVDQVLEERWVREATIEGLPEVERPPAPATSVVAVVVGEGVGRIFYSLGVRELVAGGQSMNPATADLVKAVSATGSPEVVILPNNKNVRLVAERVGDLVDQVVRVVPTDSVVEGVAALLAYDPAASAAENAAAMAASAATVTAGEVTRAVRDAECDLGPIRRGDWIGLGPGGVRAVADSVSGAARALIAALATPEHELVTLIEGDGSSPANTRRITDYLAEEFPHLAVEVHHGGQPLYPYYVGLE
ncbi:MAG: DAK2 domain-containing protein, partial [Acidimicrobiales bacterium]